MTTSGFDNAGLDGAGIHWAQYLSMTCISLLIFLISLDKAIPSFHKLILSLLSQLGILCVWLNQTKYRLSLDFFMITKDPIHKKNKKVMLFSLKLEHS